MRFKGLDLNLLIALNILLEEKSVSRSAERLHLSQPAASAALGRLREYFNDDLLVLHGKRMIPTSYAQSLVPDVTRILAQVDDLISMSAAFDPQQSERLFRVMASDYITSVVINPIVAKLRQTAPGIALDIRMPEEELQNEFERGEIDLALVPEAYLSENHPAELLFEETHVVVGCETNRAFDEQISLDTFFELSHIVVLLGPSRLPSFAYENLIELGHLRKIDVYAPLFSAVPWMLIGTNRIAVLQERLARTFASMLPIKIAPLPMNFPLMRVMMQCHSARVTDQGQVWLSEQLHATANDATDAVKASRSNTRQRQLPQDRLALHQ